MGEAKRRGTYEQRKAEGEFYAAERARLDAWYRSKMSTAKKDHRVGWTMAVIAAWAAVQTPGLYLIR